MPRLTHRLPKYSLHRASGQAKVRYQKRDHYLGPYGSDESKKRYAEFVAAIPRQQESTITAPGDSTYPEPVSSTDPPLVKEVILRYYEFAKTYYRREGEFTGEHVNIRCALRPLRNRLGDLPAREFSAKKLKLVRDDMIKLGWSRRHVNKAVSIIKRCFRWAAEEEMLPGSVAGDIWTVKGLQEYRSTAKERPPIKPASEEQINGALDHLPKLDAAVISLMRVTGMRPGEVLAMTPGGLDRSDSSCWVYRPSHHKTEHRDKTRVIFIGSKGQEIILPRLLKVGPGERLFPTTRGALCHAVHLACRKAGVLRFSPNQIRHLVATEVRARYGLEASQCILGHSRADVTQIYAERDQRLALEIVRMIG
jgi:integrase